MRQHSRQAIDEAQALLPKPELAGLQVFLQQFHTYPMPPEPLTLGRWLIQGKLPNEIATMQPVSTTPNEFWTDDFSTAAQWFRSETGDKRMRIEAPTRKARQQIKKRSRSTARR